jgi:signal transduction histidine kinase
MQTRFTRRHVLQFGLILGFVATLGRAPVFAASEQDAKDMVARAIKLFDEQGEAAFDVFNQGEAGGFLVGDLYIVIQGTGPGEKVIASAAQPSLAGTPLADIVDVTGDRFAVRISAEATEEGSWFEYQWNDPAVGKVRKKKAWAVRHKGFIFLCGIYE